MGIFYLRLLIVINENSADSTDYHIALTMLQNVNRLTKMTINELAELCAVSKSTISKFVRALGYEDFTEFRDAARIIENKYRTSYSYTNNVMRFMDRHPVEELPGILASDLQATMDNMDWAAFDRLIDDLVKYDKVAAFGLMFSETAALDLQIKLAYNYKFIITNLDDKKQMEFIRKAGPDTLIIIFSDSGDYLNRYKTIDDFPDKGVLAETQAKVVLITTNPSAARHPKVAYSILFRRTSELRTHRMVYSMITDMIAHKYRQRTHEQLQ